MTTTKRALVIGNNTYEVNKLTRCKNDAEDVGNKLQSAGFKVSPYFNLTYMGMARQINDFVEKINENDFVVFFFSGHGTEWREKNYLIPIDNKDLVKTPNLHPNWAICAQRTLDSMKERKPFAIVFLLDCCRVRVEDAKDIPLQSNSTSATTIKGVAGSLTVFACGSNEIAFERSKNDRNSLFTYHLLQHIDEPNLKIEEMMSRVCDGVYEDSNEQLYTYRLCTLRTSKIYFNNTETSKKGGKLFF
ncbi:unnamed protein product [Rotaria socialis]